VLVRGRDEVRLDQAVGRLRQLAPRLAARIDTANPRRVARALEIADRGYVMESGLITMKGNAKQMLSDPKVRAAYLGE